ncbi:MAG: FAD-binding protein [Deltaproteobacteria bacterium]|nr:FAD-binding protein [Deltaproteobacteria bacterium]
MGAPSCAFDAEVVVAGGGLAGAALALALRRQGTSVVVVDKADFPREKPCGEGLLPHGVALLQGLGLGDVVDACGGRPFRGILYHCHGVVAAGDFAHGATGRGLRRRLLDESVRARAASAGATLVRARVDRASVDPDGATLMLDDGRALRGRVLVGADGPRSTVRHSLGLDGGAPRRARFALRRHYRLRPGAALPDRVEVHVGHHHELYVTPVAAADGSGDAVIGVAALCERAVFAAQGGRPDERLDALVAACAPLAARLQGAVPDGPALSCGPLRVRARDVAQGRALLIGDAAGYVDAITGEGMSLALQTARLAVDAVGAILGDGDVDAAAARYRRARAVVFRDHAVLTQGLVELARRPFFARRVIARLGREPALFSRLLQVNDGQLPLTAFGLGNLARLALGASPR